MGDDLYTEVGSCPFQPNETCPFPSIGPNDIFLVANRQKNRSKASFYPTSLLGIGLVTSQFSFVG